jgi:hypothetical protein
MGQGAGLGKSLDQGRVWARGGKGAVDRHGWMWVVNRYGVVVREVRGGLGVGLGGVVHCIQ